MALRQRGAKEVVLNKLQNRVQKTIAYLESERGRANWSLNVVRRYNADKNLFAAVQTATRLIKYESIIEVLNEVRSRLAPVDAEKAWGFIGLVAVTEYINFLEETISDEEDDNPTTETATAEPVSAQMPGFTILQILAWTNAEIEKCREKLEVEPSGRVVAFLQGKIPGCKFAIKSIKDIFGFFEEPEHPADMGVLTMEQILGAEIDMEELKKNELWGQFLSVLEARTEELKDFLLKRAKKSRELDEYQGEYQGMTHYLKVFAFFTDHSSFAIFSFDNL